MDGSDVASRGAENDFLVKRLRSSRSEGLILDYRGATWSGFIGRFIVQY